MRDALIGIDLGGSKIEGAILDAELRVVDRERIPTEQEGGYEHVVERVVELATGLRARAGPTNRLGIGTPGAISARDGTVKNSNTQCLNGRPLKSDLEGRFGFPIHMENDANCFALAEARVGSGRGYEMVFGVILGTGVGGGIVFRDSLWVGPQHIAGEWGHHSIDPNGPECYCGQRGCVEAALSGPALEATYRRAGGGAARAAEIAARAARGEATARVVLDRWIEVFGRAMANLIAMLDPSIVVLGGGLSNLDALYDRGRAAVAASVFNDELTTPIVRHALGDSAGVIGAALLAEHAR